MATNKTVHITLEQRRTTETKQHHRGGANYTPADFDTEEIELPTQYEIVGLRNAVVIDWHQHDAGRHSLKIGDKLSEQEADAIARCPRYEVTVKK